MAVDPVVSFVPNVLCPLQPGGIQDATPCRLYWRQAASAVPDPDAPFADRTFDIQWCDRCGLAFTDPVPTEDTISALYESRESHDFQADSSGPADRLKALMARRDVRRWFASSGVIRPRSILDFGCGNGAFSRAVLDVVDDARVVASDYHAEAPPELAGALSERLGYRSYDELDHHGERYQIIICRHVLEHVHEPVGMLRRLSALLAPEGSIMLEVPWYESPLRRLFGRFWHGYYVPFHTRHYSRRGIENVVGEAGLNVISAQGAEMPTMGRNLQNVLRRPYGPALFVLGVALHPIQLAIGRVSGRSTAQQLLIRHRVGAA